MSENWVENTKLQIFAIYDVTEALKLYYKWFMTLGSSVKECISSIFLLKWGFSGQYRSKNVEKWAKRRSKAQKCGFFNN